MSPMQKGEQGQAEIGSAPRLGVLEGQKEQDAKRRELVLGLRLWDRHGVR